MRPPPDWINVSQIFAKSLTRTGRNTLNSLPNSRRRKDKKGFGWLARWSRSNG